MRMPGFAVWFTGMSGSGKSTLAIALQNALWARGWDVQVLDGDVVRKYLTPELGFSKEDRDKQVRRVGTLSTMFEQHGIACISALMSPYEETRQEVRDMHERFMLVYCDCSVEELVLRDTKGLYAKAKEGKVKNLSGVDVEYEVPFGESLWIDTERAEIDECVQYILDVLEKRGWI